MGTDYLRVGDGVFQPIETKPLTVVCPGASVQQRIEYLGFFDITLEKSLEHLGKLLAFHSGTEQYFRMVVKDFDGEFTPAAIRRDGLGFRHLAGRIDLTLCLLDAGLRRFSWKYPEAGLHPKLCANLADVMIDLTRRRRCR